MSGTAHPNATAQEAIKKILLDHLPSDLIPNLETVDGAYKLVRELPRLLVPEQVSSRDGVGRAVWTHIGDYFRIRGQLRDALAIYASLYDWLLTAQVENSTRYHKGTPLVWMSDCYLGLGLTSLWRRYLMLTLVENAIEQSGEIHPAELGSYPRLVWLAGMPDGEIHRYAKEANDIYMQDLRAGVFPEAILQTLDKEWITQGPTYQEAGTYVANQQYLRFLIGALGDGSGKKLETLAEYLMSCMPGCRTERRVNTQSTDYDVICSIDGLEHDFRSEFGRYFVCECKDWQKPADFTTVAKFCRVLDSIKSRFGILFSREGISGEGEARDADRERLKVYQDRGIVIVTIDNKDIEGLANGRNLISLLRKKYERVRLDLSN